MAEPGESATIAAELVRDFQVMVVIDKPNEAKGYGPWPLVFDESPGSGSIGLGPSPVHVALAALAACTVVTLAGVARRRKMDLRRLRVEILSDPPFRSKAAAEDAAAEATPIAKKHGLKRISLDGILSEAEIKVLERSAQHCPVARMFANGVIEFKEEIVYSPMT